MSAAKHPTVTVYRSDHLKRDKDGNTKAVVAWLWHIQALNGRILADSAEGYHRRLRALQGAQSALGLKGIEKMQPGDEKLVKRSGGPVRVVVEGGAS